MARLEVKARLRRWLAGQLGFGSKSWAGSVPWAKSGPDYFLFFFFLWLTGLAHPSVSPLFLPLLFFPFASSHRRMGPSGFGGGGEAAPVVDEAGWKRHGSGLVQAWHESYLRASLGGPGARWGSGQ